MIKKGQLEKADKTTKNCFVSPAVITIKKDKSVKAAQDARPRRKLPGTVVKYGNMEVKN